MVSGPCVSIQSAFCSIVKLTALLYFFDASVISIVNLTSLLYGDFNCCLGNNRRCNSTSLNMVTLTFRSVLSLLRHRSLTYLNRSYGSESECAMRLCGHTPKKTMELMSRDTRSADPFLETSLADLSQLPLPSRVVDGSEIVCHFMVSCFISWLG